MTRGNWRDVAHLYAVPIPKVYNFVRKVSSAATLTSKLRGCVIARKDTAITMRTQDWRAIAHNLLNRPTSSKGAFLLQLGTFGLIVLSTLFFVLESLPDVQWGGWGVLDGLIAVDFTVEIVLRFVVAPDGR